MSTSHQSFSSPIKAIEAQCLEKNALSLAQGIPHYSLSDEAAPFLMDALRSGKLDAYSPPRGIQELRNAIATYESEYSNCEISPSRVVVTAGAMEGLNSILHSILQSGDEVIVPTPTYPAFKNAVALAGGTFVPVKLDAPRNFQLDVAELEKAITPRTRALLFCSPNNPTGAVYGFEVLEALIEMALRRKIYLISDETYRDINFMLDKVPSPLSCKNGDSVTFLVHSFSKSFGMTGWRIGYAIPPKPFVETVALSHDGMMTCAPVVSQYLALFALQKGDHFRKTNSTLMKQAVTVTRDVLDNLGFTCTRPDGGYYLFARGPVRGMSGIVLARKILEECGVGVVPGEAFCDGSQGYVRICCARDPTTLGAALERMRMYFSSSRCQVDFIEFNATIPRPHG